MKVKSASISLFLLVALTAASGLLAGDGVLEINQACASVGCFPGDPAGLPVEITEPGSYILTGNLTVGDPGVDMIQVSAHDVSINLNGFSIIGPLDCGASAGFDCTPEPSGPRGSGIEGGSADRLSVRDGHIRGVTGAGIRAGASARIVGVTVRSVGRDGIDIRRGQVRDCNVIRAKGDGISADNAATFVGNEASNNDANGINCSLSCVLRENVLINNGGAGADISSGSVVGNSISSNADLGLRLGSAVSVAHNHLSSNNGDNLGSGTQISGGNQTAGNTCNGSPCT